MKINCTFTFEYPDPKFASYVKESLEVDNYKFIKTTISENKLTAITQSESLMSLLHTLEDYLSCLTTAEGIITSAQENSK